MDEPPKYSEIDPVTVIANEISKVPATHEDPVKREPHVASAAAGSDGGAPQTAEKPPGTAFDGGVQLRVEPPELSAADEPPTNNTCGHTV